MQLQFEETKALLTKECEAVKTAPEPMPIIQEVPVVDNELMDKLQEENETLKVSSLGTYLLCI